ncbi:MAG: hypothetical protein JNK15_04245 [Planctomycetes bacterium]|nr:hypothetical protein [Planctomycetota bacterium]
MPSARSCRWLVFAVAVTSLGVGIATTAWPFVVDDAFIALRYSDRFAAGLGLTWTDGERVEGFSNPLWLLLVAAFRALGVEAVSTVRALGVAAAAATLALLLRGRLLPASGPGLLAVPILAATTMLATWSIGGLESTLLLLALTTGLDRLAAALASDEERGERRQWLRAGIAFAVASWLRSDAPLWVACGAAVALLATPRPGRVSRSQRLARLVGPTAIAVAVLVGARLAYFGEWVPNTAFAKVTPNAASLSVGLAYLANNAIALRALLLPAALGVIAFASPKHNALVAVAVVGTVAWWLYVAAIGGDTFPRGRFLVPSLAALAVLAGHGLAWLAERGRGGRIGAWCVGLGCLGLAHFDAHAAPTHPSQRLSTWEWLGKATGEWLGRAFANAQPLLAVEAAGAVPYYSGLPALDLLGLCDATIAKTPLVLDHGFVPAHNCGNGPYALDRRPDLVLFATPPGSPLPMWRSGREMLASERFRANYRLVVFDGGIAELPTGPMPLAVVVWAHLHGRIGAHATSPRTIEVPGFWLHAYAPPFALGATDVAPERVQAEMVATGARLLEARVVAVHDPSADLPVAEVRRAGTFFVEGLLLAPGRYRIEAPGLPTGVRLTLQLPEGDPAAPESDTWLVPATARPTPMRLSCSVPETTPLPFRIARFTLLRTD